MANQAYKFDLKLLTPSREIGLRRLRTYAAAIGGNASIFHSYGELLNSLTGTHRTAACQIVIYDSAYQLNANELNDLNHLARVFHLQNSEAPTNILTTPSPTAGQSEGVLYCTLDALLASPIARSSLAIISRNLQFFRIEDLMQWGFASQSWADRSNLSLEATSLEFARSLDLNISSRHMLEVFLQFLQLEAQAVGLRPNDVVFRADGMTVSIVCHSQITPEYNVRPLVEMLKQYDLPTVIINKHANHSALEVAALISNEQQTQAPRDNMMLIFNNNRLVDTESVLPTLEKAG